MYRRVISKMKLKAQSPYLLVINLFLLLSSCTLPCVDLGGAIQYSTEHYTAVDISRATHEQAYQGKNGDYYAQLPIVSYTRSWPVIYLCPAFELENRESRKEPTGQYQWVRIWQEPQNKKNNITYLTSQPELANTKLVECPIPLKGFNPVIISGSPQEEPRLFLKIVAAPFDCAIDPALTLVFNLAFIPTALVTSTLVLPCINLFSKEKPSSLPN